MSSLRIAVEGTAGCPNSFEVECTATPSLELSLRFDDVPIRIVTNDAEVWSSLSQYFRPYVTTDDPTPSMVVTLIYGVPHVPGEFTDFVRPGKQPKDALQEVEGGRLILRRASGLIIGLWPGLAVAAGDLRTSRKQIINLIDGYSTWR